MRNSIKVEVLTCMLSKSESPPVPGPSCWPPWGGASPPFLLRDKSVHFDGMLESTLLLLVATVSALVAFTPTSAQDVVKYFVYVRPRSLHQSTPRQGARRPELQANGTYIRSGSVHRLKTMPRYMETQSLAVLRRIMQTSWRKLNTSSLLRVLSGTPRGIRLEAALRTSISCQFPSAPPPLRHAFQL